MVFFDEFILIGKTNSVKWDRALGFIYRLPPAALRGRLCGGHQGAAPPGPPICAALIVFLC